MMKKYTVVIEEVLVQGFEVTANSAKEAKQLAENKYLKCEFVLDSGDVQFKQIGIEDPMGCITEWTEF